MSEEKVPYSPGDQLTFYSLVNDLKKLRSAEEHQEQQLKEMARVSPGLARDPRFATIQVKTTMSLVNFDELIREYERKNERAEELAAKQKDEAEVNKTILALLRKLPAGYPEAMFRKGTMGYHLEIGRTIVFQGASPEDAIKHTTNYVEAREQHPDLPVGVIHGIYD